MDTCNDVINSGLHRFDYISYMKGFAQSIFWMVDPIEILWTLSSDHPIQI